MHAFSTIFSARSIKKFHGVLLFTTFCFGHRDQAKQGIMKSEGDRRAGLGSPPVCGEKKPQDFSKE
jgi:hypothetical protein